MIKLYIVCLFDPNFVGDQIIKVFSTKENLDKWMEYAKLMDKEIYGNSKRDITQNYKIKEADLDNLDFIDLLAHAKNLGAQVKPSNPQ